MATIQLSMHPFAIEACFLIAFGLGIWSIRGRQQVVRVLGWGVLIIWTSLLCLSIFWGLTDHRNGMAAWFNVLISAFLIAIQVTAMFVRDRKLSWRFGKGNN